MPDSLLTETEVSKHLRVSIACVRRWRLEHRGPRFFKIGSLVRYRPEDVEYWINARPAGGEGEVVESNAAIMRSVSRV
jgi:predicted DNA-binding transcriptional regulator AlpA